MPPPPGLSTVFMLGKSSCISRSKKYFIFPYLFFSYIQLFVWNFLYCVSKALILFPTYSIIQNPFTGSSCPFLPFSEATFTTYFKLCLKSSITPLACQCFPISLIQFKLLCCLQNDINLKCHLENLRPQHWHLSSSCSVQLPSQSHHVAVDRSGKI